jgi:hypothetical protein
MARSGYIAILAVLALAVAGCGGNDDSASETSAARGTSGQQGTTGAQTGATGTKDAQPKRTAKAKQGSGKRKNNNDNSSADRSATAPTAPAVPTPQDAQGDQQRTLNTKELNQVRRGLAKQARILCKASTLEALAQQYHITSGDPDEVAKAYAAGYSVNLRHAVAAGCKKGLLEAK